MTTCYLIFIMRRLEVPFIVLCLGVSKVSMCANQKLFLKGGNNMNAYCLSLRKAHFFLTIFAVVMLITSSYAAETPQPAMAKYYDVVREAAPGLPGWTVYRPANLTSDIKGRLPIVVWSNGACTITNDGYVYFLTQIAAHGFVVVAFGAPDEHTSPNGQAEADRLTKAIDWATSPPGHGGPAYFNQLDASKVATAGHSCGGVDAEYSAVTDPRVKTSVILNSGFFPVGEVVACPAACVLPCIAPRSLRPRDLHQRRAYRRCVPAIRLKLYTRYHAYHGTRRSRVAGDCRPRRLLRQRLPDYPAPSRAGRG